ncbi:MAG TPA: methyl-accepting chemotaxis protein, partial [Beijerinckiaceae bacterium]|nr:methyl-accepting chemotaxis protein [Beijerinckiaceae bacterium]
GLSLMLRARKLTIRTRLVAAFSLAAVMVLGLGLFGLHSLRATGGLLNEVTESRFPAVQSAAALDYATARLRTSYYRLLLSDDADEMKKLEKEIAERGSDIGGIRQQFDTIAISDAQREALAKFDAGWKAYLGEAAKTLEMVRQGKHKEATEHFVKKATTVARASTAALDEIKQFSHGEARKAADAGAAVYASGVKLTIVALALALTLIALCAFMIVRGISRGIASVVQPMRALAAGDLGVTIPARGQKTEIGLIADAVQVFKEGLIERRRLEDEAMERDAGEVAQKRRLLAEMAQNFERKVGGLVGQLAAAATQMEATARSMSVTADGTSTQAAGVTSAAEQTSVNVQTVAAATEELTSSIREIASQVAQSTSMSGRAVEDAKRTDGIVQALAAGAEKIGDVVALINTIAGQTNLLALNATIEAARAGEAGKGFAVVASEVKSLAAQTARATEEISAQVASIQSETQQAVAAIQSIGKTIDEMSAISGAVAAAVEEQGAATQEIARNVHEASQGTQLVTGKIVDVNRGASETGAAAAQVLAAAQELARNAASLGVQVDEFLASVKAA